MFNLTDGDDLVVNYIEACYRLRTTASPAVGGSIEISKQANCDLPGYKYGTAVTLMAVPAPGYRFAGWRGEAEGTEPSVAVVMDERISVVADFVQICHALTTQVTGGQGTIEVNTPPNCDDGQRYLDGTTVNLLATPQDNYDFGAWGGAASGGSRFAAITMDGSKEVTANFKQSQSITQGDVSCDNSVSVVDALFILKYDVGEMSGADQCPLGADELYLPACDVNGDNACNVIDALNLLQCDVGIVNVACPGVAAAQADASGDGTSPHLWVSIGEVTTQPDGSLMAPVLADIDEGSLAAATISVSYDPPHFELLSCNADPDGRFTLAACNPTADAATPGQALARFGMVSVTGVEGKATLAMLHLRPLAAEADIRQLSLLPGSAYAPDGAPMKLESITARPDNMDDRVFLPIVQ